VLDPTKADIGKLSKNKFCRREAFLRTLFVRADSIIYDKLDKLIRLFKTSSPEFFALYGNARNIVNTAARKRKNKTADEESGNE
jgi:hypothetical protein